MPFAEESYSAFSARTFSRTSGERPSPVACQFELTYRCNIHCVHCYTDPFNTPAHLRREMPYDQIIGLLDQMAEAGVLWLLLTGGEAVLHPRFRDIYKAAKARGFVVTLFSNATVMTESLVQFLAEDPPFKLEVSLHAATAETFERITQVPGSFARFEEGLRRLLDGGLPIKIKTKAMTVNRGELSAIQSYVERHGETFQLYTSIFPRLDGDLGPARYRLSGAEIADLEFGQAPADDERCSAETPGESPDVPADDRLFRCGCGTNSVTISPYGLLRACTFTTDPQFDLKTMPFSEGFDRLVAAIRSARYAGDSPCRRCAAHLYCDKNPVMARVEAGSPEAPVPHFCDVAFARRDRALEPVS